MASDKRNRNATSRRTYLKLAGAIAASSAIVGSASANKSEYDDQYGTVIDVTEVGADDSGDESITPVLEEYADDDTLLYFPSGRYYMDKQFRFTGFKNFGMVGDDAEIVPANYHTFDDEGDGNHRLFRMGVDYDPGTDLRIEGFTIDQTADETGIRVIEAEITDGLIVRDIEIIGRHDSGTFGPARFVITDSDGEGIVERFEAPDGADWTGETPGDSLWRGPTGILCNDYNKGTMTFRDCILGSFPDNGLYAANGSGSIQIEGGRFQNSMGANVRLGGNRSYIKDATIIVDQQDPHGIGQRGLRMEQGNVLVARNVDFQTNVRESPSIWVTNGAEYCYIVDSTVTVRTDEPTAAISIRSSGGQTRIKHTQVKHESGGGPAIKIKEGDQPVYLQDVTVTGEAPTNGSRSAIHNDRDGCEFRSVNVNHGGGKGRRALTNFGNDVLVYEGDYVSEDHPIEDGGEGTWFEGVSARSRRGDVGLLLKDEAKDIYVKKSHLENGIDDRSSDGYDGWGNEF
ncbi:hypothetical protein [Haladaptatus caseinilyticus]|uniref:hypothetical protein n=1 Tax=Haladaptatus caseinilyticus TaxID=2993314 RepID=UPI00224B21A4|nr:hypothetical protein [Haladaptatus caseinilyticus]